MNKDTFYFSHDYNARNDAKIKKLISKHGFLGYGLFWAIVEDLYNNANALPTDYDSIAFDLRTDSETIKSIVTNFDLFVFDKDTFGSLSIETRLKERNEKSVKARESALKRWSKLKDDANALPTQSDSNAIKESIVNENKEKESKEDEDKLPPPTPKTEFENELKIFDTFRLRYGGIKRGNPTEFKNFQKHKDWKTEIHRLLAAVEAQIADRAAKKQRNEFVPEWKNLSTWINQRCWEIEIAKQEQPKQVSINAHIPLLKS